MRKYIIFSIFLHLLAIFIGDKKAYTEVEQHLLPPFVSLDYEQKNKAETNTGEIVPKSDDVEAEEPCKKHYYGIGVYINQRIVTGVMAGYPASRLGMLKDDEILVEIPNIKDHRFILRYRRGYVTFKVDVITEKICTK